MYLHNGARPLRQFSATRALASTLKPLNFIAAHSPNGRLWRCARPRSTIRQPRRESSQPTGATRQQPGWPVRGPRGREFCVGFFRDEPGHAPVDNKQLQPQVFAAGRRNRVELRRPASSLV
jgi:hypothetical protein